MYVAHQELPDTDYGFIDYPDEWFPVSPQFGMTVHRMALSGDLLYTKLVEEHAFTPFMRP